MPETPEPTVAEPKPLQEGEIPASPDAQITALEQEIRTRNNPEEVGRRLASTAYEMRKQTFAVLRELAFRFVHCPEILECLLNGYRARWAGVQYTIANILREAGEIDAATHLYDRAFSQIFQTQPDADTLRKAAEVGIELGRHDCAARAVEQIIRLAADDFTVVSLAIGLSHHYLHSGHRQEAESIWERLLARWPQHKDVQKAHMRFKRECRRSSSAGDQEKPSERSGSCDPRFERAKALRVASDWEGLFRECSEMFTTLADNATLSFWMSTARIIATHHRDVRTANGIWAIILQHAPRHVSSYLRFSDEFNVPGQDPETDRLIQRAHTLCREIEKPIKTPLASSNETLNAMVVIDKISKTARQWLIHADRLVTAQGFSSALRIWTALLRHEQGLAPHITRGLIRIATELPPERAFDELRITETIASVPIATHLYRSAAANVRTSHPDLSLRILTTLKEASPEDAGNCLALAEALMKQKKFTEAARIWLPLWPGHANACARCAATLARLRQHSLARQLFTEVAKISPAALIRHGYEHFQNPGAADLVLQCIGPILPTGDEHKLQEHQMLALKLYVRHGASPQQSRVLLSKLVESQALSQREAERILATPPVLQSQQMQKERDVEIEEYLQQQMPGLQRAGFFRRMIQTQPLLNPGKKTSRTARSVLLHPRRLYSPDSLDPKKRHRKK